MWVMLPDFFGQDTLMGLPDSKKLLKSSEGFVKSFSIKSLCVLGARIEPFRVITGDLEHPVDKW